MNGEPPTLVAVFRSRLGRRAREHALVLEAVGIPALIAQQAGEHVVAVDPALAERASFELAEYSRENRGWRRPEELPIALGDGWPAIVAWCVGLVLVDAAARNGALGQSWRDAGANVGELVRSGEIWRAFTALTLHADAVHLLSNVVFGALFIALVSELLGNGIALLAVVGSAALGNYANAWLQGPGFASIGASTAVFAALGIVGAHRWQRRKALRSRGVPSRSSAASWVPLVACAFLLAYLGAGSNDGQRSIDVAGHVCGFLAGVLTGALLGRFVARRASSLGVQAGASLATLGVLAGAWWLAFLQ